MNSEYVKDALDELFLCPLVHASGQLEAFDRILINLTGGGDLGMTEVNQVMTEIAERLGSREDIVFGAMIDENLQRSLEVCILAKKEIEQPSASRDSESSQVIETCSREKGLWLESEIIRNDKPSVVHVSKLSKKNKATDSQHEFDFTDTEAQRGCFSKTDQNLYEGKDLDVPTYLRLGIKIKIKA